MNLVKKYRDLPAPIKASFWFLVSSVVISVIKFIVTPVHTRIMDETSYGTIGTFNAWQGTLNVIVTLSLAGGVFSNGLLDFRNNKRNFSSSVLILSTLSAVGWYLIFLVFKEYVLDITNLTTLQMTVMFLGFLVNPALGYWSAEQKFDYKYKMLTIVTLIGSFLSQGLGIVAALYLPVDKADAVIITSGLVYCAINIIIYFKILFNGKFNMELKYWKYVLVFNLPLIPHYLSFMVLSQSDRIMITNIVGADKAGIYILGYTAASILQVLYAAINASLSPYTLKNMKSKNYNNIGNIANYVLVIYVVFSLIVIVLTPEVVSILGPKSYQEAVWIIPPVVVGLYFFVVAGFFTNIEFYYKKTLFVMISTTIAAIVNILLNIIFIPLFGFLAAAYTTTLSYLVFMVVHYLFLKKIEKNEIYNIKFFFKVTCLFLLVSIFFMISYNFLLLRVIGAIILIVTLFRYKDELINSVKKITKNR